MLSKILRGAACAAAVPLELLAPDGSRVSPPAALPPGPSPARDEPAAAVARQWEQLAQQRAAEARQAGYREGEAAGRNQAAAQLQPVMERLAREIQEISHLRPRLMREAEGELVELAVTIARRILRRELTVDPQALTGLVKAALDKLPEHEICQVRVDPRLEAGLRRCLQQAGQGAAQVVADAALEPGAILIEMPRGKLDASIETQLDEIACGLADQLPAK